MHVESNKNDYNSKEIYPEVTRILYHLIHDIYSFFKTQIEENINRLLIIILENKHFTQHYQINIILFF